MSANLTVSLLRLHGDLKRGKDDGASIIVRVEFGKKVGADSAQMTPIAGSSPLDLHYNAVFDIVTETTAGVEEVANSRAIVYILEVSKGDSKKKKADTIITIGSVEIDLVPFLSGTTEFTTNVVITPVSSEPSTRPATSTGDSSPHGTNDLPSIEAKVTLSKPLLSTEQIATGNVLTINVNGVFSIPDSWALGKTGEPSYLYTLSLPIACGTDSDRIILIAGGVVVSPVQAASDDAFDVSVATDGEMLSNDDLVFRKDAKSKRNSIKFPTSVHRLYLTPEALLRLVSTIPVSRAIVVDLRRYDVKAGGASKGKGKKVDDDESIYHGVAHVIATSLLYPGSQVVNGVWRCSEYEENPVFGAEKDRNSGTSLQVLDTLEKLGRASKVDMLRSAKAEKDVLADTRTFVALSLSLTRPLVQRRAPSALIEQIAELIPPRPYASKCLSSEAQAVGDYEIQMSSMASLLADEYRKVDAGTDNPQDKEKTRLRLLYELNSTGKYHAIKEQLKKSIIQVVREKFLHTESIADSVQRHLFLSQLYVFLGDHMHKSLAKNFSFGHTAPVTPSPTTAALLQLSAHEHELLGNPTRAAGLLEELVTRYGADVDSWMRFGSFSGRQGDLAKAEGCFREAVAQQQTNVMALLSLASVISVDIARKAEASLLFEAATTVEPDSVLAWTVRAIFYDSISDDINKAMTLLEAHRALTRLTAAGATPTSAIFLSASTFYTSLGLVELAQKALAHETLASKSAMGLAIVRVLRLIKPVNEVQIESSIKHVLDIDYHNADAWSLLGCALWQSQPKRAREVLQHCLDLPVPETPDADALLLLATIQLQDKSFKDAKQNFVRYVAMVTSAQGWEGVGVSSLRLGQLDDARAAFAESNYYDNTNARVWGFLSLICIHLGQVVEAQQSFKFAMKLKLGDAALLKELQKAQEQYGMGNPFAST